MDVARLPNNHFQNQRSVEVDHYAYFATFTLQDQNVFKWSIPASFWFIFSHFQTNNFYN